MFEPDLQFQTVHAGDGRDGPYEGPGREGRGPDENHQQRHLRDLLVSRYRVGQGECGEVVTVLHVLELLQQG